MTWYAADSDHNRQDERQAAEQLYQRQGAIEDMIEGREHVDTVLDMLEEQGIDAAAYADAVHADITAIIQGNVVYMTNESGLLLPNGIVM